MKKLIVVSMLVVCSIMASMAEVISYDMYLNPYFSTFVDGTGPITANNVTGTVSGVDFTFDVTISGVNQSGSPSLDFTSNRALVDYDSDTRSRQIVMTISDVTSVGDVVTFDGFTAVKRFDNAGGDDWDVNGETITGSGYIDLATAITGPMTITAIDDGNNLNSRFEGFNASFSVPEPATLGLLGFASMAILVIRRKMLI